MSGADGRIGARAELDDAGHIVGNPEGHASRVRHTYGRRRDLAKDLVGIERRGDELDELDQRAELASECFGRIGSSFDAWSPLGTRTVHYPKLCRRLSVVRMRRTG
jgi:hypothetical protein